MAKKKENFSSPFEPAEEQPYSIPENWYWTKLDKIVSIVTGKKDVNYGSKDGIYPFFTCAAESICCNGYSFEGKSLLVPGNGANVGQVTYYDGKFEAYQRTYVLQALNSVLNLKYVFYHILSFWGNYNRDKQYGSATNYIRMSNFTNYPIVIAPIAEQQRIVDRIESLFAKLDEAKEKAQAVVDGFELRKSAILHRAFTGELTEQWRRKHGVNLSDWISTTLSKVVSGFKYGTSEKSNYTNTGMPVLRIPNIDNGILNFKDIKYLAHAGIDKANQIHENDILIIRSNGSRDLVGKCAIVPALEKEYAYASFLIRIKPSEQVLSNYLVMYLNSTDARTQMFKKAKSSVGINNINSQELGAITISVPTISEQSAIVTILDSLLVKEQQVKEAAEAVLDQIETMKKAILARAFRGELGTNDPEEEWAGELVKANAPKQAKTKGML